MKKILSVVLMVLLVLSPVISVDAATTKATSSATTKKTTTKKTTTKKTTTEKNSDKEEKKIKIHVFYAEWCGYCKSLHEFLAELAKDETYGKMFEVVDYESYSDSDNAELMSEVNTYYGYSGKTGFPVYIIGDEYFDGYGESYNDRIKKAIKDAYESGKTFNTVEKLAEKLGKDNNIVGYVILGVVAVVIIAVIVSSSKNKYYEDEIDTEAEAKENADVVSKNSNITDKASNKIKTSTTTKKKVSNSTKKVKK